MSFSQDPWRPGAAVQPAAAAEPVRENPPKQERETPAETGAETPQETPDAAADSQTPDVANTAEDDELERALAEMRGKK